MNESQFEDILSKYPELIEDGLVFKGRQVNIKGKRVDLLYEDRHGQTLIVELKRGPIKRKHIVQLMDYEGHFLSPDDPNVRVMLIGNRVPPNLRQSLDHHGFEWREIPESMIKTFIIDKGDKKLVTYFEEEVGNKTPQSRSRSDMPTATDFRCMIEQKFEDATKKGLPFIELESGPLHREMGGYPGPDHRMPVCCSVMKKNMKSGDIVLHEPPSGKGATVKIRYKIPR
jgi:5-methylcytosine-specific restriction protein A